MVRLAHDETSIPLKDRERTIFTPFRKIFAIICPLFLSVSLVHQVALLPPDPRLDSYHPWTLNITPGTPFPEVKRRKHCRHFLPKA
jgi:hypothetical protein